MTTAWGSAALDRVAAGNYAHICQCNFMAGHMTFVGLPSRNYDKD
jgi:hypothetical protein